MFLVSCALAAVVAVAAVARRRRPSAARSTCGPGLPPVLARIHYELLAARAELRDAIGMPFARTIDLRELDLRPPHLTGGEVPVGSCCVDDDGLALGWPGEDEDGIGASRTRLEQLWRRHGELLGSSMDPRWHLHGRMDWFQIGPLGRQVVHLRATSGHDAGRWVAVRAHRHASRASLGFGGGGIAVSGTIRAADRDGLLDAIHVALSGPEVAPRWTGASGSFLPGDGGRAGWGMGRWHVTSLVEVASYGWLDGHPQPSSSAAVRARGSDGPSS